MFIVRQEVTFCVLQKNSTYPDAGYPDRPGPSGKYSYM